MQSKQVIKQLSIVVIIGVCIVLLLFVITGTWIGYEVKNSCQRAKGKYTGDCVEALISVLDDERSSYKERNTAIWALGQYGDERAIPMLQKYYTGNMPEREPLDSVMSQYELRKAISLTSGGTNISAFMWRGIFSDLK